MRLVNLSKMYLSVFITGIDGRLKIRYLWRDCQLTTELAIICLGAFNNISGPNVEIRFMTVFLSK